MHIGNFLTAPHYVLSPWAMWSIFGAVVLALLFFDLFVFNRKNEVPSFVHTLVLCLLYVAAAGIFGVFVIYEEGLDKGMDFYTGFLVEKSLSLDNIFIMSLVFQAVGVPREYQHRVLFWGILGAIVMRALLIGVGDVLIVNFHWVLYVFSGILVYTGVKMVLAKDGEETDFKDSKIYQMVGRFFHVTPEIRGAHFFVCENGRHYITPLFFALVIIELMDVVFALDSIPAIFLITQDVFVVYTSNIFAILGLRALYFLLEAIVYKFKYLKYALSLILIFIGLKIFVPMLLEFEITPLQSLAVTFSLLSGGILLSIYKTRNESVK
ncbi:MAG: TerC/Alx family metal homeostasis membrane protein [Alphaproteobacteria bacterium]|nr:TerC/Alx family metal homeostasis membrane protein [Alphaproteobacteria bacterium]